MTPVETCEVNGFTVEIHYDPDATSPRDDLHDCEMVLEIKNYDLPNDAGVNLDDFATEQDFMAHLTGSENALVIQRVYGYIHSGIALNAGECTYPFNDRWDSGVAGVAYVTAKNWADTQGTEWTGTVEQVTQAGALIKSDVEAYSQYLNGECYGYRILDTDGEEMDSCWGFTGWDDVEQVAEEAANGLTHDPKCNGTLNRRTGLVEHTSDCPVHTS